ncbi:MAG: 50S ribosomal protein L6 [Nitrosopumilaceae archaeon]|nr:50S ribosomal protein L6 [Nitrosopumilaceae archaeon]NIU02520.1 50S ribosomal protein L6 [Nitrosopumilaceae archaeon]NIU88981.1 50S ribosomal protein L6 [Nitrosopumilaceae archaeon]NIV67092.1 50S ribosomal protein L6 [Nitrosopumilaceae archaeon]NIX63121.1 50S ribosomal protein L6 [Nitrosopumilaceae archaeon]
MSSEQQVQKFATEVAIPERVQLTLKKEMLHVNGPLGKTYQNFKRVPVDLEISDNKIIINSQGKRKRDYAILNTVRKIIRNLCEGVVEGYTVKMKVVYAHFPITVKAQDKWVLIENFQGERSARKAKIVGDTKVIPKGEDVLVTGPVLTDVTQTAAHIQQKTKIRRKDHRVFLDGIFVYEKTKGIEK